MEAQAQCRIYSDQVIDGFDLTHENSEHSNYAVDQSPTWNYIKANLLEHLYIPLSDIKLATNNFSKTCSIGNAGYYNLYRAELEHFDQEKFASSKEKNRSELPKKRSIVLIKRFFDDDKQVIEAFFNEIVMHTTCKHPNIVTLLGFCEEDFEIILVFEMPYVGLDVYLESKHMGTHTWSKRLRICLDVAYGLKYLHHEMEDQKIIRHRNITSTAILLDENLGAKIFEFERSVFVPLNPDYEETGDRKLDVWGFGQLLFEIACGSSATYNREMVSEARRSFNNGTLKYIVDPIIKDVSCENNFTVYTGPNEDSLDAFFRIAVACMDISSDKRPTMEIVVEELKKALSYQENNKDNLRISLEDIQLATKNFHETHCVGKGGFGKVYKGKLPQSDHTIVAKLLDISGDQGEKQFRNELQILSEYKHANIVSLLGYYGENDAKILVYEYASKESLYRHLNDACLTWVKRLKICIDVATALDFLHRGVGKQAIVIHRDIKTDNILLNDEWNAKLADFGLSLISAISKETDYVIDHACGTEGYVDPLYLKSRFLTIESDIYSFGVVLFEILCGRSTFLIHKQEGVLLPSFAKHKFDEGKLGELVFEKIKTQIMSEALTTFCTIAYGCLNEKREERPKAKEVLEQLKKTMELQMTRGDGASSSATHTSCKLQD